MSGQMRGAETPEITHASIASSNLSRRSTSFFPCSSSILPGSFLPPITNSSSHSSSNEMPGLVRPKGMCPLARDPDPLAPLGPASDPALLLLRRLRSRGGKGGSTRPPGVDGVRSSSELELGERVGEVGGSALVVVVGERRRESGIGRGAWAEAPDEEEDEGEEGGCASVDSGGGVVWEAAEDSVSRVVGGRDDDREAKRGIAARSANWR